MTPTIEATKLVVSSKQLRKALSFVGGAILSNPIVPILEDVLIEVKNGLMSLTGSDLNTTIKTDISIDSADNVSICVSHKLLSDIVSSLPEQPVTILLGSIENGFPVTIKTSSGKYKIAGENPIDYPKQKNPQIQPVILSIDEGHCKAFSQSISNCLFAVAKPNLSMENMEGVCWQGSEVAASDGHRLIRTGGNVQLSESSILIPAKAAGIIAKFLSAHSAPATVTYTGSMLEFKTNDSSISTGLIDERFPDYKRDIREKDTIEWVVNREELIGSAQRLLQLSNSETRQIGLNGDGHQIKLWVEEMTLNQEGDELLTAEISAPLQIGVNAKYLIENLRNISGETIRIGLDAPNRAILLHGEDERLTSLLMPSVINSFA